MGANVLSSIDQILSNVNTYGQFTRLWIDQITSNTTVALTTCGYTTAQRFSRTITVPSFGTGVTGAYLVNFRCGASILSGPIIVGLEVTLGALTVSGNSFSSGSSMPSRLVNGGAAALQLASIIPMIYISSTLVATSPVLTITYTNQAGTSSRSATLTLPSNAVVQSTFLVSPHLQGTDTGVRSISNMSISTGTGGSLTAYGVIPLGILNAASTTGTGLDIIAEPIGLVRLAANDSLAFYRFTANNTNQLMAMITLVPDTQ